ncbi:unnamed protein product [Ambrosiozyma monospora]|uniref:Unnamed protein product n=1 Tax=Ambrosiozyma monospora TaxID=43982 RepID=A0A9W6YXL7_AMBMO|nr:unnamed protein product [Ambrosiozyma monospora]
MPETKKNQVKSMENSFRNMSLKNRGSKSQAKSSIQQKQKHPISTNFPEEDTDSAETDKSDDNSDGWNTEVTDDEKSIVDEGHFVPKPKSQLSKEAQRLFPIAQQEEPDIEPKPKEKLSKDAQRLFPVSPKQDQKSPKSDQKSHSKSVGSSPRKAIDIKPNQKLVSKWADPEPAPSLKYSIPKGPSGKKDGFSKDTKSKFEKHDRKEDIRKKREQERDEYRKSKINSDRQWDKGKFDDHQGFSKRGNRHHSPPPRDINHNSRNQNSKWHDSHKGEISFLHSKQEEISFLSQKNHGKKDTHGPPHANGKPHFESGRFKSSHPESSRPKSSSNEWDRSHREKRNDSFFGKGKHSGNGIREPPKSQGHAIDIKREQSKNEPPNETEEERNKRLQAEYQKTVEELKNTSTADWAFEEEDGFW